LATSFLNTVSAHETLKSVRIALMAARHSVDTVPSINPANGQVIACSRGLRPSGSRRSCSARGPLNQPGKASYPRAMCELRRSRERIMAARMILPMLSFRESGKPRVEGPLRRRFRGSRFRRILVQNAANTLRTQRVPITATLRRQSAVLGVRSSRGRAVISSWNYSLAIPLSKSFQPSSPECGRLQRPVTSRRNAGRVDRELSSRSVPKDPSTVEYKAAEKSAGFDEAGAGQSDLHRKRGHGPAGGGSLREKN